LKTIPFPRALLSTLAHAQGLFKPLMGLLGGGFDGRIRILPLSDWALVVLRVGCRLDAEYVFANNVLAAEVIGWSTDKINSLNITAADVASGLGPFTLREKYILQIVDEQIDLGHTNNIQTIQNALTILNVPELVETLILTGEYSLFAGVAKGLRVAQDASLPGLVDVVRSLITSNYLQVSQS